nr:hypothetical protein [Gammaproteobacteria bacterium]
MRKIILCLIFFIYIPTYSYAEEYRKYALFDSYTNSIHTSIVATQDGNPVAIGQYNKEIRNIAISDQIELFFQNKNFIFQVNKVERGYQKITFSAENIQENGFLTVAVNRDELVGSLIYAGESYRFRPGNNGATLITKLTNAVQLDNDVKYHALVSADTYQPDRS